MCYSPEGRKKKHKFYRDVHDTIDGIRINYIIIAGDRKAVIDRR